MVFIASNSNKVCSEYYPTRYPYICMLSDQHCPQLELCCDTAVNQNYSWIITAIAEISLHVQVRYNTHKYIGHVKFKSIFQSCSCGSQKLLESNWVLCRSLTGVYVFQTCSALFRSRNSQLHKFQGILIVEPKIRGPHLDNRN